MPHDGSAPASSAYMASLREQAKAGELLAGCCAASADSPTAPIGGYAARALLAQSTNFVLRSLDAPKVRAQQAARGRPAVLRIVVNHATIGFFAAFQWVLLALSFANDAGL
eukprot:5292922-Prymnesium_polylepis.1